MQVLSINEINEVGGAYEVSAFGYTLSNGGNNANSWYQATTWGLGGAAAGSVGGLAGAGVGFAAGFASGFYGSFSLSS